MVSTQILAQVTVRVTKIDGSTEDGAWVGSNDGKSITVKTAKGIVTLPIDEIAEMGFSPTDGFVHLTLDAAKEKDSPTASVEGVAAVFHLADGGRLYGTLLPLSKSKPKSDEGLAEESVSPEGILADVPLGRAILLPYDRVAAIQFAGYSTDRNANGQEDSGLTRYSRASEAFDAALADRLPGHDVLITKGPEQVRILRGRLVEVGSASGTFAFMDRVRGFRTERIFAIVLAAGAQVHRQLEHATFALTDGSEFSGRIVRGSETSLTIATVLTETTGGQPNLHTLEIVRAAADAAQVKSGPMIQAVQIHSDRVVYLSDLPAPDYRFEGRLHRDWPPRMDRSVSGSDLVLDGQVFAKGIGMHSKTELDFDIGGGFERFVATIGIDDTVRPAGTVVFRVLGDGRVLLDSGVMTGRDESRRVVVNVDGVKVLTLVVDYGDGLDLSDHAVWGDARLLKPAAVKPASLPAGPASPAQRPELLRPATVEPASLPAGQTRPAQRPELLRPNNGGQG